MLEKKTQNVIFLVNIYLGFIKPIDKAVTGFYILSFKLDNSKNSYWIKCLHDTLLCSANTNHHSATLYNL